MRTLPRKGSWVGGLAIAFSMVLGATPAIADTVVDTDTFRLGAYESNAVCYGDCNGPAASLEWHLADGPAPRLRSVTGFASLGAYGPDGQRCARVKTIYRSKSGAKLAQRAGSGNGSLGNVACIPNGSGGNTHGGVPIDNRNVVYKTNLYSVTVILQVGPTNTGPWSKVESVTCRWKTSDCNAA